MKHNMNSAIGMIVVLLLSLLAATNALSCPFDWGMIEYTQPGGSPSFYAQNWGDEFIWWFETDDGYAIIKGDDNVVKVQSYSQTGEALRTHRKINRENPRFFPPLRKDLALLQTIPGVAWVTALTLLGELVDLRPLHARVTPWRSRCGGLDRRGHPRELPHSSLHRRPLPGGRWRSWRDRFRL